VKGEKLPERGKRNKY